VAAENVLCLSFRPVLRCFGVAVFFAVASPLFAGLAAAQEAPVSPSSGDPALLQADSLEYDEGMGVATARGDVEIVHGGDVLKADTVSYNLKTRILTATGNASFSRANGDVLFGEYLTVTDDFAEAFVERVRVLLRDDARIAARTATRSGDRYTVFEDLSFTPCKPCAEDPQRTPIWQIKAARGVHDEKEKVVRYKDAELSLLGVPLLYTPYFEHPDWTVDRRSGFLSPSLGRNGFLGFYASPPYFWAISPTSDLTLVPTVTSEQNAQLLGTYRHLFQNGWFEGTASGTIADREKEDGEIEKNVFRGHVDAFTRFDLNEHWRAGGQVRRASDDTYPRLYNISRSSTYDSRAFAEGFYDRSYVNISSASYQALRDGDSTREQPIVAPFSQVNWLTGPGSIAGGEVALDASQLSIFRQEGREVQRLSVGGAWERTLAVPGGSLLTFHFGARTTGWWTKGNDPNSSSVDPSDPEDPYTVGRFMPRAAATWRYPFVSTAGGVQQIVEPIIQGVVAPEWGNSKKIPNEDSVYAELEDTNLFSLNRFPGIDRVDEGPRLDYGLQYSVTLPSGGYGEAFVGQSQRTQHQDAYSDNSGLAGQTSDVVGRLLLMPAPWFYGSYRFRVAPDDLANPRRQELYAQAGVPLLTAYVNFIDLNDSDPAADVNERREVLIGANSHFAENWSLGGHLRRDLREDRLLEAGLGLGYSDDCFEIETTYLRKTYSDRELRPDHQVYVRVKFKYLGETGGGYSFGG